jgi:hypothetical protein
MRVSNLSATITAADKGPTKTPDSLRGRVVLQGMPKPKQGPSRARGSRSRNNRSLVVVMTLRGRPNAETQPDRRSPPEQIITCVAPGLPTRGDLRNHNDLSRPDWDPTAVRINDLSAAARSRHDRGPRRYVRCLRDSTKTRAIVDLDGALDRGEGSRDSGRIESKKQYGRAYRQRGKKCLHQESPIPNQEVYSAAVRLQAIILLQAASIEAGCAYHATHSKNQILSQFAPLDKSPVLSWRGSIFD